METREFRQIMDETDREANMRSLLNLHIPEEEAEKVSDNDAIINAALPIIGNTADVASQLRQITQLANDVEQFKLQKEEAMAFYDRRIEALETRAEMLKENCGRFLKMNGMERLSTHSGTIYFSKRTKVTLPDDETLVAFALREDPEHEFNLVIEKPNKTVLKKYIASSGHKPEGYMEEQVEGISIRKVA
jgi:hypothetical protein